jgi:hypothetical protein
MGTDVDPRGDALEVISIGKGLLHSYNQRHEDSAVQPGDRILSVNDEKGPAQMVRLMRHEKRLVCKVAGVRPEGVNQRRREGTPNSDSDRERLDWTELCMAGRADLCMVPRVMPSLNPSPVSRDHRSGSPMSRAVDLGSELDTKSPKLWPAPPPPHLNLEQSSTTAGSPPRSAQRSSFG